MRIVFISSMSGASWGGSEELWSQAALRLHEQGHQIAASVVWWPLVPSKVALLNARGVDVVRQTPTQAKLYVRLWRKIMRNSGFEHPDFAWLKQQRADLVLISQGGNVDGLAWMHFCAKERLPFATLVQCNHEGWWPSDELGDEMAIAYSAAHKVFFVSRHNQEVLERHIGKALSNGSVVWNPYNVASTGPPAWPTPNATMTLACVARLEPKAKGQDILLEVMAGAKWRDRPVQINFYGNGPGTNKLLKLAENLGLKNVHFRGHVHNVWAIWEESHLLILPSRYEGLPLALVEAMWCARPAVVTNVGGNVEVCVDGETGFVAAAPTVELFDAALERAWSQREQWQLMGQAAHRRAQQLIPSDPVGSFCQELVALAEKKQ